MRNVFFALVMLAQALAAPETFSASPDLDAAVQAAVREGVIPGAVLIIGHDGKIVHRKAYGNRALVPAKEPMTVDTIFDIASLTKVIATTPSIMKLFEQGKIRISDPVTAYLPEFQNGKSDITVRDLLTHFSGLRPDLDLKPAWTGYETGINKAMADRPMGPPGVRFVYSDINFELLGEMIRRVSGKPLDEFARDEIFVPFENGQPEGDPVDVLTGFLSDNGHAYGRPVGVAFDKTGALLVADDVGNTIWRVVASTQDAAKP